MKRAISLQGPQAVGKTTVLHAVAANYGYHVSFENIRPVVAKAKQQGLDLSRESDFVANQKLFIAAELARYAACPEGLTVFDRGPEDTECFSVNYPIAIGQSWDAEKLLAHELNQLRQCRLESILYLTASDEVLAARKTADQTRARHSFNTAHFRVYQNWFAQNPIVRMLDVGDMDRSEVESEVRLWIEEFV